MPLLSVLQHLELLCQHLLLLALLVLLQPFGSLLVLLFYFDHFGRLPPRLLNFLQHLCLLVVEHEDPIRQQRCIEIRLLLLPLYFENTWIARGRRCAIVDRAVVPRSRVGSGHLVIGTCVCLCVIGEN